MEKTPLILSPSPYPPFINSSKQPPPSYGVIHVPRYYLYTNTQQPTTSKKRNGLFPLIIIGVIVIVLALIAYFCILTPHEKRQHKLISKVLKQSPSFPSPTSSSSPSLPKTDYLDLDTPQGRLRGYTKISRQGREYTAFYKVPYAEAPINSLRFKDPIAPKIPTWSGLRDVPVVAPQCIQKEKYAPVIRSAGEEDCLYSNIYVPKINEDSTNLQELSLPVMVYIHGGGVSGNGSRYGADYFMDEDVILITIQYRLGAFGFLNTQDDVIHGNMGLKDMVQNLIWVRDHIKYYGGDNSQVTIFGNSVGGMHIGLLVLSPMTTGLFHRAISQSGANLCTSVNPSLVAVHPSTTVEEVGNVLNCSSSNSTAFRDCLLTKDAEEIALVLTPPTEYGISVERRNDDQVFMPDIPYNVLKAQPNNKVPYIIGVVNEEWSLRGLDLISDTDKVEKLNNNLESIGNEVFVVDLEEEDLKKVKEFYFGGMEIGNDTYMEAIKLISDRQMNHCSYTSAHMHSEYSPTYLYYLSKAPAWSYLKNTNPEFPVKELGMVSHGDELQYLFLFDGFPEIRKDDPEYFQFSAYLVKLWATFAATGNPNLDIEWKPVESSSNSTFWLELNDKPGRTNVLQDRMDFWDQFTHKQLRYEL